MASPDKKDEPSDTLKANSFLMKCYHLFPEDLEEFERQARGTERLKQAFSSIPFYAQRAKKDPNFWNDLYGSRINT